MLNGQKTGKTKRKGAKRLYYKTKRVSLAANIAKTALHMPLTAGYFTKTKHSPCYIP
jgi:hypothetical protein